MCDVDVKSAKGIEPLNIASVKGIDPLRIDYVHNIDPLYIDRVQNIAPLAVHIKEANHIDPLSVDDFHVSEVRNIEPLNIERFNVTHLPTVNVSVRQAPDLDLNVRRVPPLSVSLPQDFEVPSRYTVRARFFGIEFLRVLLTGHSAVWPRERFRQEQERSPERSFPLVAVAGNPAIPSRPEEKLAIRHLPPPPRPMPPAPRPPHAGAGYAPPPGGALHCGTPALSFHMPGAARPAPGESSIHSGG